MSSYAVYDTVTHLVNNLVSWDGSSSWAPPAGSSTVLLDASFAPNIGDTIDPVARTVTTPAAPSNNPGAILVKARAALANNDTFLSITTPNQAQAVTQVQALTRQVNGLLRLAANALDTVADT